MSPPIHPPPPLPTILPLNNITNNLSDTSIIKQSTPSISLIQPPPLPPRRISIVSPKLPVAIPSVEIEDQTNYNCQTQSYANQLQQSNSLSPKKYFFIVILKEII